MKLGFQLLQLRDIHGSKQIFHVRFKRLLCGRKIAVHNIRNHLRQSETYLVGVLVFIGQGFFRSCQIPFSKFLIGFYFFFCDGSYITGLQLFYG